MLGSTPADRAAAGSSVVNLLIGAAMTSCFYFLSLYVQLVLEQPPAITGLMFLPFALGVVMGAAIAVKLGTRLAPRTLMLIGAPMTAVGFAWFGFMRADGSFLVDVLGPSIIASIGFGLCLGPVVSTATHGVKDGESGMATGLLSSARQIGASLGVAILGTLAQLRLGTDVTREALAAGYGLGMLVGAAMLIIAAGYVLFILPRQQSAHPN